MIFSWIKIKPIEYPIGGLASRVWSNTIRYSVYLVSTTGLVPIYVDKTINMFENAQKNLVL